MKIEIVGKIQGKQRPRFARGIAYTPHETVAYEKAIREKYISSNGELHDGPITVQVIAYKKIAKSVPKYKRIEMRECLSKPDADNVAKIVMDALNGVAYQDDSQVCRLCVSKYWTEDDEKIIVYIGGENELNAQFIHDDSVVYKKLP